MPYPFVQLYVPINISKFALPYAKVMHTEIGGIWPTSFKYSVKPLGRHCHAEPSCLALIKVPFV